MVSDWLKSPLIGARTCHILQRPFVMMSISNGFLHFDVYSHNTEHGSNVLFQIRQN